MNYRSISDMNDAIVRGMGRVPAGIDLVVGVPRSGLLAANLFALAANVSMTDVDGFLEGRLLAAGRTRRPRGDGAAPRRVLVIDDSINRGNALREVRERLEAAGRADDCVFCAVYGADRTHPEADLVLERVPRPRLFQWNVFHHKHLQHACLDIDGVLCVDPEPHENDDGAGYERFLLGATPLHRPSVRVGHLVTSRLERYRAQTEAWLAEQGVMYGALHMLDLPSAVERRRLGAHAVHKARVYRDTPTALFIESEPAQAEQIAREAGKPVLCIETHTLHTDATLGGAALARHLRNLPLRLKLTNSPLVNARSAKAHLRAAIGVSRYEALKRIARRAQPGELGSGETDR